MLGPSALSRLGLQACCLLLWGLAACSTDPTFEYDSRPIAMIRAPLEQDGQALGATLSKVLVGGNAASLVVDTGSLFSLLRRGSCPTSVASSSYQGDIELLDPSQTDPVVRAAFRNVDLLDACPGPLAPPFGPALGLVGGDLLSNFSVAFNLPRAPTDPATMTLFSGLPATDSDLTQNGYAVIRFPFRGNVSIENSDGHGLGSAPASRVVLRACAAPRDFSVSEPVETCAKGELALRASGTNLELAVSTGHGPLVLSEDAWARITGLPAQQPEPSEPAVSSPLAADPVPAHWTSLPRLALIDGDTDGQWPKGEWPGACAELARVRRIEWTMAHQDEGACFQPCDADGSRVWTSAAYLELGGGLPVAVVGSNSDLVRALNVDVPPGAHVDGIIGAETLAGTQLEIDYQAGSTGRIVLACEADADRQSCWAAPRCARLSGSGEIHACFGQPARGFAPVCRQ